MTVRIVVSRDGEIEGELRLEREATVIGRHPDCDLVLADAAVSLRHLLLRLVGRTAYAEDLDSTNGVRINDVAVRRQVIHHLDVIRIGRHKLHVFDEAMLPGAVANLDSTVHTDYEKTTYVRDVESKAPDEPHSAVGDTTLPMAAMSEAGGAAAIHPEAPLRAVGLQRLDDGRPAEIVRLDLANTMIGEADESALVVRRRDAIFLTKLSRRRPLRINEREMGAGSHRIALDDVIEIGSLRFRVVALDG